MKTVIKGAHVGYIQMEYYRNSLNNNMIFLIA